MGEMNQTPNPEQVNVSGNGKKKKGLGPVKGLLLAILIVFLICVIGLLVRMVVEGDGDYFKPVKDLFGIEEEEEETSSKKKNKKKSDDEDEDEKENRETKTNKGKTSSNSSSRYALLSDDTEDEDVKHYRMTLDMEEIMETVMDEMSELDEDDYSSYGGSDIESMMGMAMMILPEVSDMIAGEMYFDIYFEGNEIVQIIVGYDYGEFLENLYDYLKEEAGDELEEEGIKSADDLADMLVEQFNEYLDEDALCKELMNSSDDTAETLSEMGIKEKDIKEAIDINNAKGVIEFYITGTTKLKGLMSMVLDSEEFQEELKDMATETKIKIDEDNIIESILEAMNDTDECAAYGLEFVEVD